VHTHPPPSRRRSLLIISLVFAVIASAATAAIVIAILHRPSDEEQIRAVIAGIEAAENRNDDEALKRYSCVDGVPFSLLHQLGADDVKGKNMFALPVESISVTGDKATARVRLQLGDKGRKAVDAPMRLEFVRRGDTWKACRYDITRN
jgi:hypothetical protein